MVGWWPGESVERLVGEEPLLWVGTGIYVLSMARRSMASSPGSFSRRHHPDTTLPLSRSRALHHLTDRAPRSASRRLRGTMSHAGTRHPPTCPREESKEASVSVYVTNNHLINRPQKPAALAPGSTAMNPSRRLRSVTAENLPEAIRGAKDPPHKLSEIPA